MKIPTKNLPDIVKDALKKGGFSKREIEVKVNSEVKAHGSTHAPEYDNFDYGYTWRVDLQGGLDDLQHALKPNDSKEYSVGEDEFVIDGDKHGNYATLTVNQGTYDEYIKPHEKVAGLVEKISALEGRLSYRELTLVMKNGEKIKVKSLHDASETFLQKKKGIEHATVLDNGKAFAHISPNGRVWEGTDIKADDKNLLQETASDSPFENPSKGGPFKFSKCAGDYLDKLWEKAEKQNESVTGIVKELKQAGISVMKIEDGTMDTDAEITLDKGFFVQVTGEGNEFLLWRQVGESSTHLASPLGLANLIRVIKKEYKKVTASRKASEKPHPISDEMYKAIQTKLTSLATEAHELKKSKKQSDKHKAWMLQGVVEVASEILGSGDADSEERIKALFLEANDFRLKKSSVMRYCGFYEATNGKWYMELANKEYGEQEDATTYGPFDSIGEAQEYLHDGFSNPGGYDEYSKKRPVPTKSPNGHPVVAPSSKSKYRGWVGPQ